MQCLQELLKACGRSHTLQDVYRAVEAVQQAGVASWSLDLISGLPHLTPAAWEHSLKEAIAAQPDHISVYDLQVPLLVVGTWLLCCGNEACGELCGPGWVSSPLAKCFEQLWSSAWAVNAHDKGQTV